MSILMVVVAIVILITGTIFSVYADPKYPFKTWLGGICLILGSMLLMEEGTRHSTAKDCLTGDCPYKMEIEYVYKDSVYVRSDTLIIKRE